MANEIRVRPNFVAGGLSADMASGATSMSSAGLADLPAITSVDHAALTLWRTDLAGRVTQKEIVWVTAHTGGASTATVVRGREGTTAQNWLIGDRWSLSQISSDAPVICTAATRPTNPYNGMLIWETDTGRLLMYKGTAWKLVIPELEGLAPTSPQVGPSAGGSLVLGTLTMSKSYIGLPVNIFATGNGWVLDTISTGPVDHWVELQISTDGGTNWTLSKAQTDTTNASVAKFRSTWAISQMVVATPTGSVQVRLRVGQAGGSTPAKNWYEPVINCQVVGV